MCYLHHLTDLTCLTSHLNYPSNPTRPKHPTYLNNSLYILSGIPSKSILFIQIILFAAPLTFSLLCLPLILLNRLLSFIQLVCAILCIPLFSRPLDPTHPIYLTYQIYFVHPAYRICLADSSPNLSLEVSYCSRSSYLSCLSHFLYLPCLSNRSYLSHFSCYSAKSDFSLSITRIKLRILPPNVVYPIFYTCPIYLTYLNPRIHPTCDIYPMFPTYLTTPTFHLKLIYLIHPTYLIYPIYPTYCIKCVS